MHERTTPGTIAGFAAGGHAGCCQRAVLRRPKQGDAIVLYMDGISKAGSSRQEPLNTRGIMKMLNAAPADAGAAPLVQHVIAGVEDYARGRQRDDIRLMALTAQSTAS